MNLRTFQTLSLMASLRARLLMIGALSFHVAQFSTNAQRFEEMYAFNRYSPDGYVPSGELIQARDSNFYGTTPVSNSEIPNSQYPWGFT